MSSLTSVQKFCRAVIHYSCAIVIMVRSLNMTVFESKYCISVLRHSVKLMVTIKAKFVQVYNMN